MLVTLNILETLLDTKMPGTNVQRDNTSTKFTCLQLSISFQYWKKPKTTSRVPAVWHLYHRELVFQLYIIIFLLPQAVSYLSTTVWFVFVTTAVPEVALDRSVNRESNAFIGSILDGVVNTEEDDAEGVAEAEVAFTLSRKDTAKEGLKNLVLVSIHDTG